MQKREERKTLKLEKMVWRKRGPVLDASVSSPAFFYLELFVSNVYLFSSGGYEVPSSVDQIYNLKELLRRP